jgi:hypothetical protein
LVRAAMPPAAAGLTPENASPRHAPFTYTANTPRPTVRSSNSPMRSPTRSASHKKRSETPARFRARPQPSTPKRSTSDGCSVSGRSGRSAYCASVAVPGRSVASDPHATSHPYSLRTAPSAAPT